MYGQLFLIFKLQNACRKPNPQVISKSKQEKEGF